MPFDSSIADNIDAWLNAFVPPKQKKPSKLIGSVPLVCSHSNTMNPADLQKLYSSKMRRTLDVIQNLPEVNCGCEPTTLHEQLSNQFALVHLENNVEDLWPPCSKKLDSLANPFREYELHEALNHENYAPGPDGWTYKELNSLKGFVPNFKGSTCYGRLWTHSYSMEALQQPTAFQEIEQIRTRDGEISEDFQTHCAVKRILQIIDISYCKTFVEMAGC